MFKQEVEAVSEKYKGMGRMYVRKRKLGLVVVATLLLMLQSYTWSLKQLRHRNWYTDLATGSSDEELSFDSQYA
jgi:hypothetical protein